jgi:hypothetical protein
MLMLGRRAVELLLPARAVVPLAARGAGAFDPLRPDDDRADRSAVADGARRVSRTRGRPPLAERLAAQPADALPLIFRYVVPPVDRALLGLCRDCRRRQSSSFLFSILSAGSMFAWNVYRRCFALICRSAG